MTPLLDHNVEGEESNSELTADKRHHRLYLEGVSLYQTYESISKRNLDAGGEIGNRWRATGTFL